MAVLWGISEDHIFLTLEGRFWDFRSMAVLWVILETVLGGGWWVFETASLMGVPPKPSGTLGPSAAERHSPPGSSSRQSYLLPPPVGIGPHTPLFHRPEGLFSWYEWPETFRVGLWCSFFLGVLSWFTNYDLESFRGGSPQAGWANTPETNWTRIHSELGLQVTILNTISLGLINSVIVTS